MRRASLVWVVFAGCVAFAAPCALADGSDLIGKPARSMSLRTLDGKTFDLGSLRGKVVLVSFWATWCAPCREEMPTLGAFYSRYHDRGLEMIAISVDRPKDRARVLKASKALAYPTAMLNEVVVDGFGEPEGVPLTWVVDADGIVRDQFIAVDDDLLAKVVVPLLPPAPAPEAKP